MHWDWQRWLQVIIIVAVGTRQVMYFNVNFDQQELMLSGHDDGQLMVWKMTAAKEQVFAIIWNDEDPPIQKTFTLSDLPVVFVIRSSWYSLVPRPWQVCLIISFFTNDPLPLWREHLVTCSEDQTICVYQSHNLLEAKPPLQHRLQKIIGNVHENDSHDDDDNE